MSSHIVQEGAMSGALNRPLTGIEAARAELQASQIERELRKLLLSIPQLHVTSHVQVRNLMLVTKQTPAEDFQRNAVSVEIRSNVSASPLVRVICKYDGWLYCLIRGKTAWRESATHQASVFDKIKQILVEKLHT
ncbi:MAG: hypothetical protein JWN64_604 [Parcubacteria group bacterium]|nr:hypothetical protein [Parcubacteria group bacterium]